ncbi:MAG TPA: 1,2-phenylacetyl-CoA epoxidase subunit PaaC, partial [Chitinophagaceae bacterium]|nr:1,2-phenylacetyl-CoA epoxidase subunit PaaC [Chitinophagaceae bacterium]
DTMINKSTGQLINYTLHLADNALILGHRNSEWCGHGPVLEQDIAITNISLDLIGQARNFYQYAAQLINQSLQSTDSKVPSPVIASKAKQGEGGEVSEDTLAYLRDVREFKNCLLVEQPNGDWAHTVLRQFFFSTYQYYLYQQLQNSNDEQLAAIAAKSLKEVSYHLRWSSEWVIRLGDGTEESHQRMLKAIDELWSYTGELLIPAEYEKEIGIDFNKIKEEWNNKVKTVLDEATLIPPPAGGGGGAVHTGGKNGFHSEHLGHILAELQFMQRAYPNSEW